MRLSDFFSNRSDFASESDIKKTIRKSKNFDEAKESPIQSAALLLFATSRQQTWLVCTPERLYCILDDLKNPRPKVNWSMKREDIVSEGKVTVSLRAHSRTEKTGSVDISQLHQRWLFSHKLFKDGDVVEKIRLLIANQML